MGRWEECEAGLRLMFESLKTYSLNSVNIKLVPIKVKNRTKPHTQKTIRHTELKQDRFLSHRIRAKRSILSV